MWGTSNLWMGTCLASSSTISCLLAYWAVWAWACFVAFVCLTRSGTTVDEVQLFPPHGDWTSLASCLLITAKLAFCILVPRKSSSPTISFKRSCSPSDFCLLPLLNHQLKKKVLTFGYGKIMLEIFLFLHSLAALMFVARYFSCCFPMSGMRIGLHL